MDEHERRAWAAADAALDQLLDIAPEDRAAALAAMDLPPPVRERVERLLHPDADALAKLERPFHVEAPRALAGQTIGRWRVGAEIGRGGMSVVHAAEATDRPEQRAAIKFLAAGALAGEGLNRFRREQAILARLSHPHIAPMFDAGVMADGTPWLAMALVEGARIDVYCRRRQLDVASRVRLLLDVCDAVGHAHQALVIHRDLKPGNVLVDDAGHVRLLDFGIARIGDASDGERTATAYRALTPDYAAPEQFDGAPPSTAMDVWGIGALAYQLLTGRPPRAAAAVDGSLNRPSRAVADDHFGDATTTQRARRDQRGDLDAIVLKALAPEPAQRYPSVVLLADDLRRWLDGQPVSALPPTLRYRAGKFVRRHRGGVAAAAIAVLGVLGGLAASIWQAQRAEQSAAVARAETARAEAAQVRAETQLRRAESLREFLTRLFVASDPDRPASERPSLEALLDAGARQALEATDIDPVVQVDMLTTIGRVHLFAHQPERGRELLEAALQRARAAGESAVVEQAQALYWLSQARSGGDATRWSDAELDEAATLLAERAPDARLRIEIARTRAEQRLTRRDPAGGLAQIEPILAGTWNGPVPTDEERIRLLGTAALLRAYEGDAAGARAAFSEVIAAGRRSPRASTRGFAVTLANSVDAELAGGDLREAEARAREAIAIHDRIGSAPNAFRASARVYLGRTLVAQGRFDAAREALDASSLEWATLRGKALEDYAYTHLARGRLAASALDAAGAWRDLTRFVEQAQAQGLDIGGFRAEVDAERGAAACSAGRVVEGRGLVAAAAAAPATWDRERSAIALQEGHATCALADGDAQAALAALDAPALADALPNVDPAARLRPELLRCRVLAALDRTPECRALAARALEQLDAAGLTQHPYRARFAALAAGDAPDPR